MLLNEVVSCKGYVTSVVDEDENILFVEL